MGNFFTAFLVLLFLLETFNLTYSYGGINRTFLSLTHGVIEKSVFELAEENGSYKPYYKQDVLEMAVCQYLNSNLAKFTDEYYISFYYYQVADLSVCISEKCDGVQIHLQTDIGSLVAYDKILRFELHLKGETLNE